MRLIVFAVRADAIRAGFKPHGMLPHPKDPDLVPWWPELGPEALRHLELSHVFITEAFDRFISGGATNRERDEWIETARIVIPARLRLEPMLIVQL